MINHPHAFKTLIVSPWAREIHPVVSPAHRQLRDLQRALYEKAYAEAHALIASSPHIVAYSNKFEASLPNSFERASLRDVLDTMRSQAIVLYGDFHTLKQSQRGLVRLLRGYVQRYRRTSLVIALEMFKAKDQPAIDAYLEGTINEEQLLKATNYAREWGFPWPHYKMILDVAREFQLPVVGINSDNAGRDALSHRDRFAAKQLLAASRLYPRHNVICLIGEYHLADEHLPAALAAEQKAQGSQVRSVRIVTNVDRYYFKLPSKLVHSSTEYLRLGDDLFCIMNSPPWMKWQSYAIWEEMRAGGVPSLDFTETEFDAGGDIYTEDSFDVDYQFYGMVKNLASFLRVDTSGRDFSKFHFYASPEADFHKELKRVHGLSPAEIERCLERASTDGIHFLSASNTVLITDISLNNLAEAAGQYLHKALTDFADSAADPFEDFYRRVLKYAAGMLSSKILNPRRKCADLAFFERFLAQHQRRRLVGPLARQRDAAKAVLRHHDWLSGRLQKHGGRFGHPPARICVVDLATNFEVSRSIGLLLGHSLYTRVMSNQAPTDLVRQSFTSPTVDFTAIWRRITTLYNLLG